MIFGCANSAKGWHTFFVHRYSTYGIECGREDKRGERERIKEKFFLTLYVISALCRLPIKKSEEKL